MPAMAYYTLGDISNIIATQIRHYPELVLFFLSLWQLLVPRKHDMVDLEPILGILDMTWEYTMDGIRDVNLH